MNDSDRQLYIRRAETATRWLWIVLPIVIGLELTIGVLYLWGIARGTPFEILDFNSYALPSRLQVGLILSLAAICGWRLLRTNATVPSRLLLRLSIGVLTFAAADELFKIHLMSSNETVRRAFVGLYLGAIAALPILFLRDLGRVWRVDRGSVLLAASGLSLFAAGAFGSEWIFNLAIAPLWSHLGSPFGETAIDIESVRSAAEELGELIGETLIVAAALRFQWVSTALPTTSAQT